MCGIFGYQFKCGVLSEGRRALLASKLAMDNDDRGGHSYGFARFDGGKIEIGRGLGDFGPRAYKLVGSETLIGHTRWATHGEKTVVNAHPFEIGGIIGAHNGIIYNHSDLNKKYARAFAVDSMHIFAHIDAGRDVDDLEGYGSVEYVKREDPSRIFLSRMLGGELAIAGIGKHPDPVGIVWSSDERHLKAALRFAGFKADEWFEYEVPQGVVMYARDGVLYKTDDTLNLKKYDWPARDWRTYGGIDTDWAEMAREWRAEGTAKIEKMQLDADRKVTDWPVCELCGCEADDEIDGIELCAECLERETGGNKLSDVCDLLVTGGDAPAPNFEAGNRLGGGRYFKIGNY